MFSRAASIFACLRPSDVSFSLDLSRRDPFLADALFRVVLSSNGWNDADVSLSSVEDFEGDAVAVATAEDAVSPSSSLRVEAQALRDDETAVAGTTC